jgi:hypothetical protein
MSMTAIEFSARPQPGPRIAPPLPSASVPWAAVLDHGPQDELCTWVMTEGLLIPVASTDQTHSGGRRRAGRLLRALRGRVRR